jgi:LytS/YehU family sensor histidine kinase
VIPLFPPFVVDIRATLDVIAAFAGGPWVAIAVGILCGLPSGVPMADLPYSITLGLIMTLAAKAAWKYRGPKGYAILFITIVIAEAVVLTMVCLIFAYALQMAPFWPQMVATFLGGTYFVYIAVEWIPLVLCIKLFPDFMKPRWLWRGGEEAD